MPRGNLEIIYPRALVLAGVRKYIENKKYKPAYLACRSHMVDMNILHDYSPTQFMENIALFIDQLKKVEFIDEFLSHLRYVYPDEYNQCVATNRTCRNEDVCETVYKDTLKIAHSSERTADMTDINRGAPNGVGVPSKENKVNQICDGFLSVLRHRIDTNLQNLVTAHVCKSPPDLDAGLQLVAGLRGKSAVISCSFRWKQ